MVKFRFSNGDRVIEVELSEGAYLAMRQGLAEDETFEYSSDGLYIVLPPLEEMLDA